MPTNPLFDYIGGPAANNSLLPVSDNPLTAQAPTLADGWQANAQAYGDFVARERQSGVANGLLDSVTGWPTQNALIDAAHQYGAALIGSTAAPGMKAGVITETPEFQNWFGGSKAVDAAGKPLVVYHGTANNFDSFDRSKIKDNQDHSFGFHFTSHPDEAAAYAGETGANVQPVYVKAANPLELETDHPRASMEADLNKYDIISKLIGAKRSGNPYDSVIIRTNSKNGPVNTNVIAFSPEQIKSAIGNSGAFNPKDPRITAGIAGLTAGGAAVAGQQPNRDAQ